MSHNSLREPRFMITPLLFRSSIFSLYIFARSGDFLAYFATFYFYLMLGTNLSELRDKPQEAPLVLERRLDHF